MAKFKIWMVALTLLMGISFTSCVETDPTVTQVTFGQVTSFMPTVITIPGGFQITAVNSLADKDLYPGDYVYFQYSYDSDEQKVDENTKNINATVIIGEKMTYSSAIEAENKGEGYENVTMIQIGNGPESNLRFMYYDKSKIIVPVIFLAEKEISKHTFTLVYDQADFEERSEELKLYLRHNSSEEDSKSQATSYKLFSIDNALSEFANANNGKKPEKITIYANETKNFNSDDLKDKKDELTAYTVEYIYKDK